MKPIDKALIAVAVVCWALWAHQTFDPLGRVESPFPSDGYWLLVAHEAQELSGAKPAANAAVIRSEPGLQRRVRDYDSPAAPPFDAALAWAAERSGHKPYYVVRKGRRAREGPLIGTPEQMLATLTDALAEVR